MESKYIYIYIHSTQRKGIFPLSLSSSYHSIFYRHHSEIYKEESTFIKQHRSYIEKKEKKKKPLEPQNLYCTYNGKTSNHLEDTCKGQTLHNIYIYSVYCLVLPSCLILQRRIYIYIPSCCILQGRTFINTLAVIHIES